VTAKTSNTSGRSCTVSGHPATVERRLVTRAGVPLEDVITMRHALAYIREHTSLGSGMAMRDLVRLPIS
jgi:hypothetical protein